MLTHTSIYYFALITYNLSFCKTYFIKYFLNSSKNPKFMLIMKNLCKFVNCHVFLFFCYMLIEGRFMNTICLCFSW
uniref:Uncharacterized protein n=1 Tax=Rhizophora mucronata TaxID=61149 RepID=A0A2P2QZB0_RHIMU